MDSNNTAVTLDGEGLPTFKEIEPNAVQENLTKSGHLRSYFLTTILWLSPVALIILLICGFTDMLKMPLLCIWISFVSAYFLNCMECCCSSTMKYLTNKFDSADELVDFIS